MGSREREILRVFAKYGFDLLRGRFGRPTSLRKALEELGPVFIKLGQVLSTRPDLIPQEYIDELSKLQDSLPPVPFEEIERVLREELKNYEEFIERVEEEPISSASIGQVHKGYLRDGTEVAIKVIKPKSLKTIREDLKVLKSIVKRLSKVNFLKDFNLPSLYEEFAQTLLNETDYLREGRNLEVLRRNFSEDEEVYFPKVFWNLTTRRVLVMEFLKGTSIKDKEELRRRGIDLKRIAEVGARAYMKMIFRDGFFHGDPHPGNFLILRDGRLGIVDCGIVGFLDSYTRINLMQLLVGIFNQNVELILDSLRDLGMALNWEKISRIKGEVFILLSHYASVPLNEIKISYVLRDIAGISFKYGIRIPNNLALLMRAFGMAEGLGMSLDPNFRLIDYMKPYVGVGKTLSKELLREELSLNYFKALKAFVKREEKNKADKSLENINEILKKINKNLTILNLILTIFLIILTILILIFLFKA